MVPLLRNPLTYSLIMIGGYILGIQYMMEYEEDNLANILEQMYKSSYNHFADIQRRYLHIQLMLDPQLISHFKTYLLYIMTYTFAAMTLGYIKGVKLLAWSLFIVHVTQVMLLDNEGILRDDDKKDSVMWGIPYSYFVIITAVLIALGEIFSQSVYPQPMIMQKNETKTEKSK